MVQDNFDSRLRREVKIINISLTLIFLVLIFVSISSYNYYRGQIDETIISYGKLGLFIIVFLLELIPQILNPYFPLLIAIPFLGLFNSIIIVIIASLMGSILGFEIGRKYGFKFIIPLFQRKNFKKILKFWSTYGKWFVTISALTPIPYVPIIFGALALSRKDFFIFGIIPRIVSFLFVGFCWSLGLNFF